MSEAVLSERDFQILNELEFDPDSKPILDCMRSCLVWEDEFPKEVRLSEAGRYVLDALILYRAVLQGVLTPEMIFPEGADRHTCLLRIQMVWEELRSQGLAWPGFQREKLGEAGRQLVEEARRERRQRLESSTKRRGDGGNSDPTPGGTTG